MNDDPEAPFSMKRGMAASGALHVSLVLLALFGGQLFESDGAQAIQFAEVDLISGAEFDAALSSAPKAPRDELKAPAVPQVAEAAEVDSESDATPGLAEARDLETPPEQEREPDLENLARLDAPGAVLLTAPRPREAVEEDAAPLGASPMEAPAPVGPERLDAPLRQDRMAAIDTSPPREADRVAPEAAPEPDTLARDTEATPETTPDEVAETETTEEQAPAAAPPEATTEIVTEADETSDELKPAPVATAPPRGRPDSVNAAAEAARTAPETPAREENEPTETASAEPEPAPAAEEGERTPRRTTDAPLGPQLTNGEIEGLRLGLSKFWRIDRVTNLPNYEELVVTMRVNLDQNGNIIGAPEPVSPASAPDGRFKIAIDVARIALQRAEPFPLPPEKYGRWKTIEVTFNPKNRGVYF